VLSLPACILQTFDSMKKLKVDFETQESSQRVSNKMDPAYATKTDITMDTNPAYGTVISIKMDTNPAYATITTTTT